MQIVIISVNGMIIPIKVRRLGASQSGKQLFAMKSQT
jgi:hypothetical protein